MLQKQQPGWRKELCTAVAVYDITKENQELTAGSVICGQNLYSIVFFSATSTSLVQVSDVKCWKKNDYF